VWSVEWNKKKDASKITTCCRSSNKPRDDRELNASRFSSPLLDHTPFPATKPSSHLRNLITIHEVCREWNHERNGRRRRNLNSIRLLVMKEN